MESSPPRSGEIKNRAKSEMLSVWRKCLVVPTREDRQMKKWISSCLDRWLARGREALHFHFTQVLTDHGRFGDFLFKINREKSPLCRFYDEGVGDNARHTITKCSAWRNVREKAGWPGEEDAPNWDELMNPSGQTKLGMPQSSVQGILKIKKNAERAQQWQPLAGQCRRNSSLEEEDVGGLPSADNLAGGDSNSDGASPGGGGIHRRKRMRFCLPSESGELMKINPNVCYV